jgi:hypothetical protein
MFGHRAPRGRAAAGYHQERPCAQRYAGSPGRRRDRTLVAGQTRGDDPPMLRGYPIPDRTRRICVAGVAATMLRH